MPALRRYLLFSATFAVWASLSSPGNAQSLHTASQIVRDASLVGMDGESDPRFEFSQQIEAQASATTLVAFSNLARWGSWRGAVDQQAVWLQDESWLCGDLQWDHAQLQVSSNLLKLPPISLNSVRGMILLPPASSGEFIALRSDMRAASGDRDSVWLTGGSKLTGIARLSADPAAGHAQTLTIEHAGRSVELDIDSVRAIVFSPALVGPLDDTSLIEPSFDGKEIPNVALAAKRCIALRDGSLLNLNTLHVGSTQVEFELAAGIRATALDPPDILAQEVTYLSGKPAGVEFLAARPPDAFRNLSDSMLEWSLGRNQDLWQRPLLVDGGMVARGLAMHATSQAAYRWDGRPARLLAELVPAEPAAAGKPSQATVRCKVLLAQDGKLRTAAEYELSRRGSGRVSVAGGPQRRAVVDIDLTGAQLVALVTESATLGSYSDHVLWLDARIAIQEDR